jgi:uncharacterized protein (UPF0332 family)
MTGKDFVELAERLIEVTGPAEYRTAINRAYYGAYNEAAALLRALGCSLSETGKDHRFVRNRLHASGNRDLRQAGVQLATLYSLRERADYVLSDAAIEQADSAAVALGAALRVLRLLDVTQKLGQAEREALARMVSRPETWSS